MSAELPAPLARVCRLLAAPRSTANHRRRRHLLAAQGVAPPRPGPPGTISDEAMLVLIR